MVAYFNAEAARKHEKERELTEVLAAIRSAIDNKMSQCYITYALMPETIFKLKEIGYELHKINGILSLVFNVRYIIKW